MKFLSLVSFVFFALILCVVQAMAASTPPNGTILTWHNDNFRTGWQQQETILTTSTVPKLGISQTVTLKDQVDAQPLVIPGFINSHDIAFVADESNNVYQIDANTGAILRQRNDFGAPVPRPLSCGNNGPDVGITGTPVIDWNTQTLFVIAYVNGATPTYFLHALDLLKLADKVPPLPVVASHTLTNGSTVTFNATNQRQRAALLFANNNVYAAFSSFCDSKGALSTSNPLPARGWLLGWSWNGTTLTALPANQLDDRQSSSATNQMLDSIWMSGAGPASDEQGNLIFSTGNSDSAYGQPQMPSPGTWTDGIPCSGTGTGTPPTKVACSNIQESVVKINGALTQITGLFSPNGTFGNFSPNTLQMDNTDEDLGSGGVLLAPQRGGAFLAATAGKDGRLFLLDRSGTGLKFLQLHQGEGCWCAPSYFVGVNDGIGRVVTSQGNQVQTFHVIPLTSLSPSGTSAVSASSGQDAGFFTTVSCNGSGAFGNCTDTPIIWAVSRPISTTSTGVNLYAFSGFAVTGGKYPLILGPMTVGSWPNIAANANIVPTVSNGRVYVASNKLLTILNVGGTQSLPLATAEATTPTPTSGFAVSGTLASINGSVLTLTNRNGKQRLIDASKAIANDRIEPAMIPGGAYTAVGSSFTSSGALQADTIYRAKCRQHKEAVKDLTAQPKCTGDQWPPDRDQGL